MVAVPEADCSTEDCSLALYMGFVGDDRNSNAFQTGYQISQVNQYAVSTLYNNIVQQVSSLSIVEGTLSSYLHAQRTVFFSPQLLTRLLECSKMSVLRPMQGCLYVLELLGQWYIPGLNFRTTPRLFFMASRSQMC